MILWPTSYRNDQCENDEPKYNENLHTAEPEFEFSEDPDSEIVNGNDRGEK